MSSSRDHLYAILLISCVVGYVYLFYSMSLPGESHGTFCLFKNISGVACPSCGSTRAVIAILQGRVSDSLHYNPLGLLIASVMLISPLWVTRDLLQRKETLLICYRQLEKLISQPSVYLPIILLILANWIWNILKGL